ncbi:MAG TPA: DMT family transporter [Candidatus Eisenbacteria bacterium]|nr:DMT family transporter [Candidatus Eisenbacteria bacterium]
MKRFQGVIILALATFLFGMYGIYSRLIGQGFEVFSQNWIRNLFVTLIALLAVVLSRKWTSLRKEDVPPILGWIVCDSLITICLFLSFNHLPIGTALFLLYSGTTITGYIVGSVVLKEKLNSNKIIAIILSLTGLFIIFGFSLGKLPILYVFTAISAGILGGIWNIFPKFISAKYSSFQLIVFDAGAIFLTSLPLAFLFHQKTPPLSINLPWIGIVLYGLTQFVGDQLMIYGFRKVEAHVGSLITPLEAVFGTILAFIFFKESLSGMTLIGGGLVVFGAILPNVFYQINKN